MPMRHCRTIRQLGPALALLAALPASASPLEEPAQGELAGHETTIAEFRAFLDATGYVPELLRATPAKPCGLQGEGKRWDAPGYPITPNHPVTCVTPADARAYVAWRSMVDSRPVRLPTADEMRRAMKPDGRTPFWGNNAAGACRYGNFLDAPRPDWPDRVACADDWAEPAPVAQFAADPSGRYDVAGNVAELTSTCSLPVPPGGPPIPVERCTYWEVRGGSHQHFPADADPDSEITYETGLLEEGEATPAIGFRVVVEAAPGPTLAALPRSTCEPLASPVGWQACEATRTGTGVWVREQEYRNAQGTVEFALTTGAEVNAAFLSTKLQREVAIRPTPLGLVAQVSGTLEGEPLEGDPLVTPSATLCQPEQGRAWYRCAFTELTTNDGMFWVWVEPYSDSTSAGLSAWHADRGLRFRLCAASSVPAMVTIAADGGDVWSRMTNEAAGLSGSSGAEPYCTSIQIASSSVDTLSPPLRFLAVWSKGAPDLPAALDFEGVPEGEGVQATAIIEWPWPALVSAAHD